MAGRNKSTAKAHPHDMQVPASPKVVPPGGQHRRSVPQGVEKTAQVLMHEAGSVHKAKKAIDAAAEMERHHEFREDHLAVRLGFPSRKEMLAASKPIADGGGAHWWATPSAEGSWVVWNEQTVSAAKYATLEEAKRSFSERADGEPTKGEAFPEGFNG